MIIGDAGFFGISASPFSPLHTPNEVPDSELGLRADLGWSAVKDARRKILISHTPPAKYSVGCHSLWRARW